MVGEGARLGKRRRRRTAYADADPMPRASHTITLPDGARLHAERFGPTGGPGLAAPLVFVHGFPIQGGIWYDAAERLCGARPCIVPDLRGFGRSTPPAADRIEGTTIATYADDLVAMLDALGEPPELGAIFCGLSMGGIILFELWRRHPRRVAGLIFCDCRPEPESEPGKATRRQRAEAALRDGAAGVRGVAEQMIGPVLAPSPDAGVRAAVLEMMCQTPPAGLAAGSLALASRPDSWPTLATITVPTMFIVGEQDQITGVDLHRQMSAKVPGAKLEVIAGAGHVPPMEATELFVDALSKFCS